MRHLAITITALVLNAAACQSKPAPAVDAPTAAKEATAPNVSTQPAASAPETARTASKIDEPATDEPKRTGVYPVRASSTNVKALIPNTGDYVVNLQAVDGTWYMLGLRQGIPMSDGVEITRDERLGGVHYGLQLDEAGTKALQALSTAQLGKRMAFVVDDKVIMAPVVKAVIDSGRLEVSCASKEAVCFEAMESLADAKGGSSAPAH